MNARGEYGKDEGASLLEYSLLVTLVALVALAGVFVFGEGVRDLFSDSSNTIVTSTTP